MHTIITTQLFDAYLKCPTKCFRGSRSLAKGANAYAEWLRAREQAYVDGYIRHATQNQAADQYVFSPSVTPRLRTAKWRLAFGLKASTQNIESTIQVVERIPSGNQGHDDEIIPIRLSSVNKVIKENRLLLALDSLVLSEMTGRKVRSGKIVHGDNYAGLKVRTDVLSCQVRESIKEIDLLLSEDSPPELALNEHCNQCEFQAICRQEAIEHDDLSLLPSISGKERRKFNTKGIFTINHLSYTFRPRRKSKRFSGKCERYHHSLKALAIREHKIHVVGSFDLRIKEALYRFKSIVLGVV